jgi:hypothetical protein
MNAGDISGNSASKGGGVYVAYRGMCLMYGREISGNSATVAGGGVYLLFDANVFELIVTFVKYKGTIYGYDGSANSNTVRNPLGVIQNKKGHAVYCKASETYNGGSRYIDTTHLPKDGNMGLFLGAFIGDAWKN